jgi:hypothetical protein
MKGAPITLEQVLSEAEALPPEDQIILEELLHKRRIENWRKETAAAGRKAVKTFQTGKLKGQSVEDVIVTLRESK